MLGHDPTERVWAAVGGDIGLGNGTVYEHPAYLEAAAGHVGAEVELIESEGASIPLVRYPDRSRRTVYGLPAPFGPGSSDALPGLAVAIARLNAPVTAVLSPIHGGYELARALIELGARTTGERVIAVTDLEHDPAPHFHRSVRGKIARAVRLGVATEVGPLQPWFGSLYRAAMQDLDADPVYFFRDDYFECLAEVGHYVVSAVNEDGVAAAGLFLTDGVECYYHLAGRRSHSQRATTGAMNMVLADGIAYARETGCVRVVLGGGRTDSKDDSLLQFKLGYATQVLPRLAVRVDGEAHD